MYDWSSNRCRTWHSSHRIESCSSTSGRPLHSCNQCPSSWRSCARIHRRGCDEQGSICIFYILNCTSESIRYIYYYYICIFQIFIYRTWRFSMSILARSSIKSPKQFAVIEINTTATAAQKRGIVLSSMKHESRRQRIKKKKKRP